MSDDLYRTDLLRLAADLSHAGRLPAPDGTGVAANALCGDKVTFDVTLDTHGRIAELSHDTKACVLAQASSAVLGAHGTGCDAHDFAVLDTEVRRMLSGEGAGPAGRWNAYGALAQAAPYRNRHACVLLPLEALRSALASASAQ